MYIRDTDILMTFGSVSFSLCFAFACEKRTTSRSGSESGVCAIALLLIKLGPLEYGGSIRGVGVHGKEYNTTHDILKQLEAIEYRE